MNDMRASSLSLPSLFVLPLVIRERFIEATQDLGCCFEHRFELGFVNIFYVRTKVSNGFLEALPHLLGMAPRILD